MAGRKTVARKGNPRKEMSYDDAYSLASDLRERYEENDTGNGVRRFDRGCVDVEVLYLAHAAILRIDGPPNYNIYADAFDTPEEAQREWDRREPRPLMTRENPNRFVVERGDRICNVASKNRADAKRLVGRLDGSAYMWLSGFFQTDTHTDLAVALAEYADERAAAGDPISVDDLATEIINNDYKIIDGVPHLMGPPRQRRNPQRFVVERGDPVWNVVDSHTGSLRFSGEHDRAKAFAERKNRDGGDRLIVEKGDPVWNVVDSNTGSLRFSGPHDKAKAFAERKNARDNPTVNPAPAREPSRIHALAARLVNGD